MQYCCFLEVIRIKNLIKIMFDYEETILFCNDGSCVDGLQE